MYLRVPRACKYATTNLRAKGLHSANDDEPLSRERKGCALSFSLSLFRERGLSLSPSLSREETCASRVAGRVRGGFVWARDVSEFGVAHGGEEALLGGDRAADLGHEQVALGRQSDFGREALDHLYQPRLEREDALPARPRRLAQPAPENSPEMLLFPKPNAHTKTERFF